METIIKFPFATPTHCPFCGSNESILIKDNDSGFTEYVIICNNCKATGGYAETKEKAIDKWNTRKYF